MRPTTHGEKRGTLAFVNNRKKEKTRIAFVVKERQRTPRRLNLGQCPEDTVWQYYFKAKDGLEGVVHTAEEIRQSLIERYMAYAASIAISHWKCMPKYSLATLDDLQQSAFFGLTEAVDRYQFGHGTTFTQFANRRIYGAIIDCLRNLQDFPRVIAYIRRKHRGTLQSLAHKLGRFPTESDIEEHIGAIACCELCDPLVATGVYNQFMVVDEGVERDGLDQANDMKPKKSKRSHNRSLEHEGTLLIAIDDSDVRFAVYAKFWLNWNLRQIGRSLNCSPSTVHNRIEEGKQIIKAAFSVQELEAILDDE